MAPVMARHGPAPRGDAAGTGPAPALPRKELPYRHRLLPSRSQPSASAQLNSTLHLKIPMNVMGARLVQLRSDAS